MSHYNEEIRTTIADIPVGETFELGEGHEDTGDRFTVAKHNTSLFGQLSGRPQSRYLDENGEEWEGPSGWEALPVD
jgi:hypothetical protein